MMNKYYVYIHVKDGKVIYCGKGIKKVYDCGKLYDRAYEGRGRKYNIKEVEVFKVKYFDNEQQALEYEAFLTSWYKACSQCEYNIDIANHHTEETRKRLREINMGENNPMYGKTGEKSPLYSRQLSEEHRRKISEAESGEKHPRCRPVVAFTDSGSYYKEFNYIRQAESELGVSHSAITQCCKGKRKSVGKIIVNGKKEKLRWKYKEKQ